ncbi:MAG TPA: hypothetical protein VGE01_09205 [Fimbriimonas sp.]
MRCCYRCLCLLALALFGWTGAKAADILILLDIDRAGPAVDPFAYYHGGWILWPPSVESGVNRTLALGSGANLLGQATDLPIRNEDGWRSLARESLARRGYFEARDRTLGGIQPEAVLSPEGYLSASAALIALSASDEAVRPLPLGPGIEDRRLLVAAAREWDEVRRFADTAGGRALVLEFPPPAKDDWSRYWLFGSGWPEGKLPVDTDLGVPGLVEARDALRLTTEPALFDWQETNIESWGGANRWLAHVRFLGTFGLVLLAVLALGSVLWALRLMAVETRHPAAAMAILVSLLLPATILLQGNLSYRLGLAGWPLWLALSLGVLLALAAIAAKAAPLSALQAVCGVGWVAALLADPTWSWFSSAFGWPQLAAAERAPWAAFAPFAVLASVAERKGRWGLSLVFAAVLWEVSASGVAVGAALALSVVFEPWFRAWYVATAALPAVAVVALKGYGWAPTGLLQTWKADPAINAAEYARFALSPPFVAAALLAALVALFADRFLIHQFRTLLRSDPARQGPFLAALGLFLLGIGWPEMLWVGGSVLWAGFLRLLYEGVGSG